jgi:hypothetical protein
MQCNRIESRVITGEALPLSLQLGPAILWFKILSNEATEQLYQLCPYNYHTIKVIFQHGLPSRGTPQYHK